MAQMISEKLGLDGKLLKEVSINDLKWEAPRPKDSSLNVSKAISILNHKPQKIDYNINNFIDEIEK
jgi:dTDP-4-dehydrorhamnose reductase